MRIFAPVLLAIVASSHSPVVAQRLAATYSPAHLPSAFGFTSLTLDLNGDGFVDIVDQSAAGSVWRVSFNDGGGRFLPPRSIDLPAGVEAVPDAFGDFDADGDQDRLVVANGTELRIASNDGSGNFSVGATALLVPFEWQHFLTGDVDNDGDADVVVYGGLTTATLRDGEVWLNDGTGAFARHQQFSGFFVFGSADEALIDVDGDGDLDFLSHQYWENDGAGTFVDRTASRFALSPLTSGLLFFADLNGDGRADFTSRLGVSFDDGSGVFAAPVPIPSTPTPLSPVVADADSDGDNDLVVGRFGDIPELLLNDGSGNFTSAGPAAFPESALGFGFFDVVDVDGDSDLDLLNPSSKLFISDGAGRYHDATVSLLPRGDTDFRGSSWGDLDGDGDADTVVRTVTELRIYRNDGPLGFTRGIGIPTARVYGDSVEIVDFDGDGFADIAKGINVLRGDGNGGFAVAYAALPTFARYGVTFDADGDGDPDIAYPGGVLFNDGNMMFRAVSNATVGDAKAMDAADIDGDGDTDFVLVNYSGRGFNNVWLYLNDGLGGFTDVTTANLPPGPFLGFAEDVIFADVDGDGDSDLIVGHENFSWQSIQIYENDGSGVFTDKTLSILGTSFAPFARTAAVADFDLDGDVDIFISGIERYFFERTPAGFVQSTASWVEQAFEDFAYGVDLDLDGDTDLVVERQTGTPRALHNLRRQLVAPRLARTGSDVLLIAHVEAPVVETVYPFVSLFSFNPTLPTPWGPLLADAGTAIPLPPQPATIDTPAEWEFGIPGVPALVGVDLFSQALFVPNANPISWRLSNGVQHRIIE